MNGTVIFGAIALFFILSALMGFVNDLHDDVESKSNYGHSQEVKSENYYDVNVVGEQTLVLSELSDLEKKRIWDASTLKIEMMDSFPDFSLMSELVKERIIDNSDFKKNLLKKIETTEEEYIGGVTTGQSVKATLSSF